MISFSPGLVLIAAAALIALFPQRGRVPIAVAAPLVTLLCVWGVPEGTGPTLQFLGQTLDPVHGSAVARLFATIFAIAAFGAAVFGIHCARPVEYVAAFIYAGAAIGVTFAGDWITLLIFWELMAVASTGVIWAGGTQRAWRASLRYLYIHLLGGVILMFGIAGHVLQTGTVEVGPVALTSPAAWMMLIGVVINAGAPPLWAWVADAYPEASPSGSVFLSAFTTKTAVFVLLVAFPGAPVLIPLGLVMVAYGAIYALLADDMRRLLSYSIVGQVGFMVVCIGVGTDLALDAAAAHAFAHILYKALLLMAAGAVIHMTGRRLLSELGGLGRTMRLTAAAGLLGGLAIAAAPLTAGYASKSLISAALGKADAAPAWFGVMAGSALALVYVGLRFPWFAFFHRDTGIRTEDPPPTMCAAMVAMAGLILIFGIFPELLYVLLPYGSTYQPYTAAHVIGQVELLAFSALVFFTLLPLVRPQPGITLDFDWIWRRAAGRFAHELIEVISSTRDDLEVRGKQRLGRIIDGLFQHHGPRGILARTWPTGSMVLWVAVLLIAFLLLYYF
jgi:multicomponent Na+:H+ antiporter subunit D